MEMTSLGSTIPWRYESSASSGCVEGALTNSLRRQVEHSSFHGCHLTNFAHNKALTKINLTTKPALAHESAGGPLDDQEREPSVLPTSVHTYSAFPTMASSMSSNVGFSTGTALDTSGAAGAATAAAAVPSDMLSGRRRRFLPAGTGGG